MILHSKIGEFYINYLENKMRNKLWKNMICDSMSTFFAVYFFYIIMVVKQMMSTIRQLIIQMYNLFFNVCSNVSFEPINDYLVSP